MTSYTMHDVYDYHVSKDIAVLYLSYWGEEYQRTQHKKPSFEVLARIWNGGPNGWKKHSTVKYWKKVSAEMKKRKRR